MGDLTKNISREEVACKCGCGFDTADYKTIIIVQRVCDYFETTVNINSWCRCINHNFKVGGSVESQHLEGRAADCVFSGIYPSDVWNMLVFWYPELYGFGLYSWGTHIDTRSTGPARWNK